MLVARHSLSPLTVCAFVGLVILNSALSAATVSNTNDSGPGSLRQAIVDTPAGGTVSFALVGCPCIILLTSGELSIVKDLTIVGPGPNQLTVSGNNASRVLRIIGPILGPRIVVSLEGLKITDGNAGPLPPQGSDEGGGILIRQATVTIRDALVSNNTAAIGGGIAIQQGNVSIFDSRLSRNSGGFGAGISNTSSFSMLSLTGCQVIDNFGMGLYANMFTTNQVTNSTFARNQSFAAYIFIHSTLTVTNSTFDENGGDATIALETSSGKFTNSTISANSSGGYAIYQFNGQDDPYVPARHTLEITNTTIAGSSGSLHTEGGSEDFPTTMTIKNSIIAGNVGSQPDIEQVGAYSTTISEGHNLIRNAGTLVKKFNSVGDQAGTPQSPIDPRLEPLAVNGGLTRTHALKLNSPAVDKGKALGSEADQRGMSRPNDNPELPNAPGGDGSDIGAYEVQFPVHGVAGIVGRVLFSGSVRRGSAFVTLTDPAHNVRYATVNPTGHFRFVDVPLGRSFVVGLMARGRSIKPQSVFVGEDISNLVLTAGRSP